MEWSVISLTLPQSLHLVVITPALLIILYLEFSHRFKLVVQIPVLLFLSLALGSIRELLPHISDHAVNHHLLFLLRMADALLPALCFLLVSQFIHKNVPPIHHWLILLVPLIATSPFIQLTSIDESVCVLDEICIASEQLFFLNNIILSAFVLILVTVMLSLAKRRTQGLKKLTSHEYWLVISLVLFNVLRLMLDLRALQGEVNHANYMLASALIKLALMYMVITSIFRVFYKMLNPDSTLSAHKMPLSDYELTIAKKAKKLLEEEKLYRDLAFNRSVFAQRLGIKEHMLSRIVNQNFKKSFSEIANNYRIEEAQTLLIETEDSVTAISFDVGFNSLTSFNRVFKELVGVSPSQYRQEHQENDNGSGTAA